MELTFLNNLLSSSKNIVLLPHARPDADALGSSIGFGRILKKLGHSIKIISPTEYPNFLNWMVSGVEVEVYSVNNKDTLELIIQNADIIICIDFSSINRINDLEMLVSKSLAQKVIIDHHPNPEDFTQMKVWDPQASATAVLIYRITKHLRLLDKIDKHTANCLYAGIMTDTGSFQHPNTTAEAHSISCDLITKGANASMVSKNIYNSSSLNKLKFWGFAFTNRLYVMEDYNTAYFALKKEDHQKFNLQTGDTEGLVNFALSIKNIFCAALIADKGDKVIRISLRSIGDYPVNTLAQNYFSGGGHKNAAGGKSDLSLEETVKKFEQMIKENIQIRA